MSVHNRIQHFVSMMEWTHEDKCAFSAPGNNGCIHNNAAHLITLFFPFTCRGIVQRAWHLSENLIQSSHTVFSYKSTFLSIQGDQHGVDASSQCARAFFTSGRLQPSINLWPGSTTSCLPIFSRKRVRCRHCQFHKREWTHTCSHTFLAYIITNILKKDGIFTLITVY